MVPFFKRESSISTVEIYKLDRSFVLYSKVIKKETDRDDVYNYTEFLRECAYFGIKGEPWHLIHDFSIIESYSPMIVSYLVDLVKWADINNRKTGYIILPKHMNRSDVERTVRVVFSMLRWSSKTTDLAVMLFPKNFEEAFERAVQWDKNGTCQPGGAS